MRVGGIGAVVAVSFGAQRVAGRRKPAVYTRLAVDVGVSMGAHSGTSVGPAVPAAGDLDDTTLAIGLVRGDPRALETLYERHSRAVYSLALHLLGDRGAAEEVVQETFVKLWRRPASYQPQRGRLLPWLLGVAHHHCVDLLRRRQLEMRHRAATPIDQEWTGEDPRARARGLSDRTDGDLAAQAGGAEERQQVIQALGSLPDAQRVPLELAYYRGLSQSEIAQLLQEPLGTIKTRMRLGLLRLRALPALVEVWNGR